VPYAVTYFLGAIHFLLHGNRDHSLQLKINFFSDAFKLSLKAPNSFMSVRSSVCGHVSTRLPLDGFS